MELRLFIAVELPASWTAAIAALQQRLRQGGLEHLRWVRPEGVHLTLKFLGNVEERRVAAIGEAVSHAARAIPAFDLTLDGLGMFGPPSQPRVVWTGVTGDLPALSRLWRAVETQVSALGFPQERQRFAPHLTLGRVPQDLAAALVRGIPGVLAKTATPATPSLTVSEVALIRSDLGAGGARYTRLATAPLAPQSAATPPQP